MVQRLRYSNLVSCMLSHAQQCEDLESEEQLRHLFRIVRVAIMLNEPQLLDELLKVGQASMPSGYMATYHSWQSRKLRHLASR